MRHGELRSLTEDVYVEKQALSILPVPLTVGQTAACHVWCSIILFAKGFESRVPAPVGHPGWGTFQLRRDIAEEHYPAVGSAQDASLVDQPQCRIEDNLVQLERVIGYRLPVPTRVGQPLHAEGMVPLVRGPGVPRRKHDLSGGDLILSRTVDIPIANIRQAS